MSELVIRKTESKDIKWINDLIKKRWHGDFVVAHGVVYIPGDLPGFVALITKRRCGLGTYTMNNKECEIVTIDSLWENKGIGSKLIDKILETAKENKCNRVWLITTNDNIRAINFYKKRGFKITAIHKDALEKSRRLKPSIPHESSTGMAIKDEIELEYKL